jgi:hypothetical protein
MSAANVTWTNIKLDLAQSNAIQCNLEMNGGFFTYISDGKVSDDSCCGSQEFRLEMSIGEL